MIKGFIIMQILIGIYILFHWRMFYSSYEILIQGGIWVSMGLWLGYVATKFTSSDNELNISKQEKKC